MKLPYESDKINNPILFHLQGSVHQKCPKMWDCQQHGLQLTHHQWADHDAKVILCTYIICKSGSDFCLLPRMNWPKEKVPLTSCVTD
jgi:hypothetical protein